MIDDYKIKLFFRFVLLAFICYISYMVVSLHYVNNFTNVSYVLSIVHASVFGVLAILVRAHFKYNINKV